MRSQTLYFEIPISGNSMFPFIKSGTTLICKFLNNDPLKIDCVYLAKENSEYVAHRIIEFNGKTYFKGDWSTHLSEIEKVRIFAEVEKIKVNKNIYLNLHEIPKNWCHLISKLSLNLTSAFKIVRLINRFLLFVFIKFIQLKFRKQII